MPLMSWWVTAVTISLVVSLRGVRGDSENKIRIPKIEFNAPQDRRMRKEAAWRDLGRERI